MKTPFTNRAQAGHLLAERLLSLHLPGGAQYGGVQVVHPHSLRFAD